MMLTMTKMFDMDHGRYSILVYKDFQLWVMEREWNFNRPNVSCVPRGLYTLEPHSTTKYPNTWALIGDAVSHAKSGKPRFACVLHRSVYPTSLEGCLTVAKSIGAVGEAQGAREAMTELRSLLKKNFGTIQVLMQ